VKFVKIIFILGDFDIPSFELVDDDLDEEKIKSLMEDTFKVERRAEEQENIVKT